MYRVAQEQLFHPRYTTLRSVLYSYAAEGGLTGKQLLAVTEVRRADWVEEGVALVGVQECYKDRSGLCAHVYFCNCTATNTCTELEESSSMALAWSLLFLVQVLLTFTSSSIKSLHCTFVCTGDLSYVPRCVFLVFCLSVSVLRVTA